MCEKAVEDEPETIEYVPNHLKTEEMHKEAVCKETYALRHVPDHLKTQEMCKKSHLYLVTGTKNFLTKKN